MKDLIERYINEVGRHLPRAKRADVTAELRSLIQDSLDAKAGDAEPTEEQVVAVLKEFGPPREVASSYSPTRKHLIGPGLYPIFEMVLKIGIVVLLCVQIVSMAFALAGGGSVTDVVLSTFGGLLQRGFSMIGSMIVIFALLEWQGVQPEPEKEEWDPRKLPRIAPRDEINRGELGGEIAAALFMLWVLNIYGNGTGLEATADSPIARMVLDPSVRPYIVASTFLLLVEAILCVTLLVQGHWSMLTKTIWAASQAVWVVLLLMFASVDWATLIEREWGLGQYGLYVRVMYYIIALFIAGDGIRKAYRYFRTDASADTLPKGNGSTPAPAGH